MGKIGNGTVPVLEVEGVEELLGALGADFGQRVAHGERGAGVLGHGEGEDLGVGAMDGDDFRLVPGGGREGRFVEHKKALADRIRHEAGEASGRRRGALP